MEASIFIGGLIGAVFLFVFLQGLAGVISAEAVGWTARFNRSIARCSILLLPQDHRERWLDELEADLRTYDERPLSGTVHAILAAVRVRRLARELRPVRLGSAGRAPALTLTGDHEEDAARMLGYVARLRDEEPESASLGYASAAEFFREQGDSNRALELYELAVESAPSPGRHVAQALTAMAEIRQERGEADEALMLLKAALATRARVSA